jgi:hypothetical protein
MTNKKRTSIWSVLIVSGFLLYVFVKEGSGPNSAQAEAPASVATMQPSQPCSTRAFDPNYGVVVDKLDMLATEHDYKNAVESLQSAQHASENYRRAGDNVMAEQAQRDTDTRQQDVARLRQALACAQIKSKQHAY